MLEHGGKLRYAAQRYGIALDEWLDLSTGLNPQSWPLCDIPAEVWARLPEDDDELRGLAQQYYAAAHCLPVAGSQAAIQILPQLYIARKDQLRVGMLSPAYAEHAHAWRSAGFEVRLLAVDEIDAQLSTLDILLLVNPNNPTGHLFSSAQLLRWHQLLILRGGSLIVDEAFMDATPDDSLAAYSDRDGLIVLRSLGKFFGLAGARVGFVLAEPNTLERLNNILGPWPISGPSRVIAMAALDDSVWQAQTRQSLPQQGQRLKSLLQKYALSPDGGTVLFQWLKMPLAKSIYQQLAQQGILVRLFSEPSSLRFGLPANETQWRRLESALARLDQFSFSCDEVVA